MNFLTREQKGVAYVLISGLCYGLIGYFGIKIMQENFSAYNMLFWRFVVASIIMFALCFWQMKDQKLLQNHFGEMVKVFFNSAIFHGSASAFYFVSSVKIGTGLAMIMFFAYPLVVVILNRIFYKTKITASYFFSIIAILVGITLLGDLQGFEINFYGIIFGTLAAIFFGCYVFSVQQSKLPPLTMAFVVCLGCLGASALFALVDGSLVIPQNSKPYFDIVAMGLISTALPILFFLQSLKYINSTKASLLGVSEPLAVLYFGWLLLDEKISALQLLGSLIILVGGVLALIEKNKKSAKNQAVDIV